VTARVVDALGTWCPVPIHLIDRAAREAAPGSEIALLADDPLIRVDLPAWCHSSGNELLALEEDGDGWVGRVRVSPRGGRAPAHGRGRGRSAPG
jgi:tRNA 2-thiouridine synthesizing protein A